MPFGILAFLKLAGSLGLFIYGMKVMSEGLQKMAGTGMRTALNAITRARWKGVLTGLGITAVLQYSSATTVMVVSFVNAGLMNLRQAIPVIMGANIGTTLKALLISVLGFASLPLAELCIPIIGLAFPLMFLRSDRWRRVAQFLIGFALLFLGLDFLRDNVPVLSPGALYFLRDLGDNGIFSVLLFVLFGLFLAVVIQSSSAALALTMVLCENGTIGYPMAAAIVLGENIGTTVTANVAALVGNVYAKRAARAHLMFNVIGVLWALLLFSPILRGVAWLVREGTGGSPFTDVHAVKYGLAWFHVLFNTLNTLLLVGLVPFLELLVTRMVPSRGEADEEHRLEYIDTDVPLPAELTELEARREIVKLGRLCGRMLEMTRDLLTVTAAGERERLLRRIARYEEITDRMELEVGRYLTKTGAEVRDEASSSRIRALLAIAGDLERVGDIFFQMSKALERRSDDRLWFTPEQRNNLLQMMAVLEKAFAVMHRNLEGDGTNVALDEAVMVEEQINQLRDQLRKAHLRSIESGDYNVRSGLVYTDLFNSCEKVGDHLINVSEALSGEF
ncbi:MAG: Na/Pi cotransporter family protein [Flavobacteriales bacterium]|jgi:phosphate:Na+ symporter|nr:Na/Pi cotransporter family protein [Flavobacteriales bacterium]MBK7942631.1 Na/Pi cotransporter family protein [Flavobacteriales bacterium]MBK9698965.1 Na/Pi cotransporter family protein [Flavobacteriales bacterium]